MPVAPAPDAPSSTWYCAGGTATGAKAGVAEQTIEIANLSDQDLTAKVTAMPSQGAIGREGRRGRGPQPPVDRAVDAWWWRPYASAVVEADGGEVAVSHVLTGPTGTSTAACSSAPSSTWYFPSGNSEKASADPPAAGPVQPVPERCRRRGHVRHRRRLAGAGRVTRPSSSPATRVTVRDVADTVTLRTEIATTVTVRSGRIIADQIQYADGSAGHHQVADRHARCAAGRGPPGGSPTGRPGAGDQTSIAVQNPSDHDVDVELQIRLDDADANGDVDPFTFTVPAGRAVVTNVSADGRVPPGIGYTAVATATDGTPIVADRVVTESEPQPGVTVTMGSPALGTRWIVPVASAPTATATAIIVTNPSATDPVTVTVSSVANGTESPIHGRVTRS